MQEPPSHESDTDFEPMHTSPQRVVGVLLLLAAIAGGLWFANARLRESRRADELLRASTAWNELRRCLVGNGPPRGMRATTWAHLVELGQGRAVAQLPPAERLQRWPYRCATHASVITHALFEAGAREGDFALFAAMVSRAASALERGQLFTGRGDRLAYLDEMLALRERVQLPSAPAARGPLPPELPPWTPLRTEGLTMLDLNADARTAGVHNVGLVDPYAALDGTGFTLRASSRGICSFDETLQTLRCTSGRRTLPRPFREAENLPVAAEERASPPEKHGSFWLLLQRSATSASTTADAGTQDASVPDADAAADGSTNARGVWWVAAEPAAGAPFAWLRAGEAQLPEANDPVQTCGSSVLLRRLEQRIVLVFLNNGTATLHTLEAPKDASALCTNTGVRLAWWERYRREAHSAQCTPAGCNVVHAGLTELESDPVIAPVGSGEVVVVAESPSGHGLRFRVGVPRALEDAEERTAIESSFHGGLTLDPPSVAFSNGNFAAILVTEASQPRRVFGVRIDAEGNFVSVRTDHSVP